MTFPKAEKGIKKIYFSQFVLMIGSFLEAVAAALSVVGYYIYDDLPETNIMVMQIVVVSVALISLFMVGIGFMMTFFGIRKAAVEDENFKVAKYSIIFSVIIQAAGIIWAANPAVVSITNLLTTVTFFLSVAYIILGIRSLAGKLGCEELDKRGEVLYNAVSVLFAFMTIADVATLIFTDTSAAIIASYLQVAGSIMTVVQLVLLLSYLKRAKKMFAEN